MSIEADLPSPDCELPTKEQLDETVTALHGDLFSAGFSRSVLLSVGTQYIGSRWEVEKDDVTGEITAPRKTITQSISLFVKDTFHNFLSARKITTLGDNGVTKVDSQLKIAPLVGGTFSFDAHIINGVCKPIEYADLREYRGIFNILGELTIERLTKSEVHILPQFERTTRDHKTQQTNNILTAGRLREVEQCVREGIWRLTHIP